jgi:hypothetical protein
MFEVNKYDELFVSYPANPIKPSNWRTIEEGEGGLGLGSTNTLDPQQFPSNSEVVHELYYGLSHSVQ